MASGNRQQTPLIMQIINWKALVDIHPMEACIEGGAQSHILSIITCFRIPDPLALVRESSHLFEGGIKWRFRIDIES